MHTYKGTRWLATLPLLAMVCACAPDGNLESMMVFSNTLVSKKTQCIAETGGGATTEAQQLGVLDLMVANHYWMYPMIFNGLSSSQETLGLSPAQMALDAHTISIKGAWVTYEIDGLEGSYLDGAETTLTKQWLPTSGSVLPEAFQTVKLEAVPPTIVNALDKDKAFDRIGSAGYLTLTLKFEGVMADGTVVHSDDFHYAITVCRGCLTTYEVAPQDCCKFEASPEFFPCFPGQDERYSCLSGCFLVDRDRPDRYAQKMALFAGFTKSLEVDLTSLELPEWFLLKIAEVPGQNETETPPEEDAGT
jgi:hypothetical protein